jgi:hypothetical protein
MNKGELIWFITCLLFGLFWCVSAIFWDATPQRRLLSVVLIVVETIFIANSWRKLTCEKSKSS